ncbi:FimD/PapC N-terminal domain-containing protein, partial [Escherichia coli]
QAVADLSRFENGQELPPGTYRVDIYLNNGYMATRDVTFNTGDKEPDKKTSQTMLTNMQALCVSLVKS